MRQAGNIENSEPVGGEVGGRLRYLSDQTTDGGRLGSSI